MNKKISVVGNTVAAALTLVSSTGLVAAQTVLTEKQISLSAANDAAQATLATCRQAGFRISVAVLDRGGNLKVILREDGAGLHTVDSARRKAYTALTFRVPSAEFAQRTSATPALTNLEEVLALAGGLPIRSGEEVIGAIGVGGAPSGDRDAACAQAGLDRIKSRL
ncbi:MAG: heme-binding protein [Thermosynechococcaceae cyanobacterium MS004]|nr:heme-binding protein [Thermosynechococcaceae cyanobacterium MS004]